MIEWFKTNVYNKDLSMSKGKVHQWVNDNLIFWWHFDGITCVRFGHYLKKRYRRLEWSDINIRFAYKPYTEPQLIFGKSKLFGHRVLTLFSKEILK